jgi:Kef-type K+ transport system membrane component KefB
VSPIKQISSGSKRNIKEVIKRILRTIELLLGIFFAIIGAELFLFVDNETVYGVVFFLIGVGFLLHFYTTRKRRELKPIDSIQSMKGGEAVRDESWKEKKGRC